MLNKEAENNNENYIDVGKEARNGSGNYLDVA